MASTSRKKERPTASIPIYYVPEESDWDSLLSEPSDDDKKAGGSQKFYSALRYADDQIEVPVWYTE